VTITPELEAQILALLPRREVAPQHHRPATARASRHRRQGVGPGRSAAHWPTHTIIPDRSLPSLYPPNAGEVPNPDRGEREINGKCVGEAEPGRRRPRVATASTRSAASSRAGGRHSALPNYRPHERHGDLGGGLAANGSGNRSSQPWVSGCSMGRIELTMRPHRSAQ
jgi:hypothetical protein